MATQAGHHSRHRGLHVAGAGEGLPGRSSQRRLLVRRRAVRDADRPAAVPGRHGAGSARLGARPRSGLAALPADLNPRLAELVRRCLEKNPKRRWQAIGDVRAEIEAIAAMPAVTPAASLAVAPPRPFWRRALPVAAAAVVTGVLAAAAASYLKPAPLCEVARLVIALPEESVPAEDNPRGGHLPRRTNSTRSDLLPEGKVPEILREQRSRRRARLGLSPVLR